MKTNNHNGLKTIILALIISLICMVPCIGEKIPNGDDMTFHILRMESVYNAIKTGQGFPVYIYDKLLEGYGYGAGIFYPDILLLPAVLFRFMGLSPTGAMKGYIFLLLLFTCYTSYRAGKEIGKSHFIGLVAMILYTMGHYHLEDIYRRSAMGEVVAMAFIPLVFLALYDYTEREERRKGLLCLAFSGLLLCHTISFVLCVGIAVVWVLVRIKKVLDKKHIGGLLAEAGSCMLLTAFYWVPVLEQFADGTFYVSTNPAFETQDSTMTILGIMSGDFSVSFIELGIFLLLVIVGIRSQIRNKKAVLCLCFSVGLLIIETSLFPWKLIDKTPLISLQFPWRLNMFTEFFGAFGIGIQLQVLYKYKVLTDRSYKRCFVLCILIGVINLTMVYLDDSIQYKNFGDKYINEAKNTIKIGAGEWLPSKADLKQTVFSKDNGIIYFGRITEKKGKGVYDLDGSYVFNADGKYDYCIIPKYYYKGYVAEYLAEDGNVSKVLLKKDADTALISLFLNGKSGKIRVYYKGTDLQMITKFVSLFFAGLWLIRIFYLKKYNKEKSYNEMQEVIMQK